MTANKIVTWQSLVPVIILFISLPRIMDHFAVWNSRNNAYFIKFLLSLCLQCYGNMKKNGAPKNFIQKDKIALEYFI